MADRKQKLQDITAKLEQGIKEMFESDRYREYLSTAAKFHSYSVNNIALILMQKPDATQVAGYKAWQKNFERNVKKGEKAITILAPTQFKVKERRRAVNPDTQQYISDEKGNPVYEDVEATRQSFIAVSVFDISQTEGKPLPEIVTKLTGTVDNYGEFFEALKSVAPVPVEFENIAEQSTSGYFSRTDHRIAVRAGMSEAQTVKTTVHEIAHSLLHDSDEGAKKDRTTKEVEAESVAYIVCAKYGIETSDYSFGYIAGWSEGKGIKELKGSLTLIRDTAAKMIDGIDKALKSSEKEAA